MIKAGQCRGLLTRHMILKAKRFSLCQVSLQSAELTLHFYALTLLDLFNSNCPFWLHLCGNTCNVPVT